MALRDKLRERVQPMLEPGEVIHSVFMAQTASPYWSLVSYWIVIIKGGYRVVAVTDRNIVTFKASSLAPSKPKALLRRLPRGPIGPFEGKLWGKVTIGGETMWVNRRFHGDVTAADAATPAG